MEETLQKIYKYEDMLRATQRKLEDELISYQRRVFSLHTHKKEVLMQTRHEHQKMLMLQRIEQLNEATTNYNDTNKLLNNIESI